MCSGTTRPNSSSRPLLISTVFTRGIQPTGGYRAWLPGIVSCVCAILIGLGQYGTAGAADGRAEGGLLALYKFDSGKGNTIKDRSAISPPLDLTIENPSAVTWNRGGLVVRSATKISSTKPARKITDAVKRPAGLRSKHGSNRPTIVRMARRGSFRFRRIRVKGTLRSDRMGSATMSVCARRQPAPMGYHRRLRLTR